MLPPVASAIMTYYRRAMPANIHNTNIHHGRNITAAIIVASLSSSKLSLRMAYCREVPVGNEAGNIYFTARRYGIEIMFSGAFQNYCREMPRKYWHRATSWSMLHCITTAATITSAQKCFLWNILKRASAAVTIFLHYWRKVKCTYLWAMSYFIVNDIRGWRCAPAIDNASRQTVDNRGGSMRQLSNRNSGEILIYLSRSSSGQGKWNDEMHVISEDCLMSTLLKKDIIWWANITNGSVAD